MLLNEPHDMCFWIRVFIREYCGISGYMSDHNYFFEIWPTCGSSNLFPTMYKLFTFTSIRVHVVIYSARVYRECSIIWWRYVWDFIQAECMHFSGILSSIYCKLTQRCNWYHSYSSSLPWSRGSHSEEYFSSGFENPRRQTKEVSVQVCSFCPHLICWVLNDFFFNLPVMCPRKKFPRLEPPHSSLRYVYYIYTRSFLIN